MGLETAELLLIGVSTCCDYMTNWRVNAEVTGVHGNTVPSPCAGQQHVSVRQAAGVLSGAVGACRGD